MNTFNDSPKEPQKAIEVGADVALVDLVERQNELGMPLDSRKPYRLILVYFSKKQDLRNVVRPSSALSHLVDHHVVP